MHAMPARKYFALKSLVGQSDLKGNNAFYLGGSSSCMPIDCRTAFNAGDIVQFIHVHVSVGMIHLARHTTAEHEAR